MSATFEKIAFVGVMVAVTFVGSGIGAARKPATGIATDNLSPSAAAPPFVLPSLASPIVSSSSAGTHVPPSSPQAVLEGDASPAASVFRRVTSSPPPDISSPVALVADLTSGESYLNVGVRKRWPLASLTKLVTAVVAAETMDEGREITLVDHDFAVADNAAAKNVTVGGTYRLRDLVRAMLVFSSNEAAEAVANSYGRANFIAEMNGIAREWGLSSTNFSDPTGLSPSNQSTAEDLLVLARRTYGEHPELFRITREKETTLTELGSRTTRTVLNINLFAGRPDFLGGKTGYTDEAGGNLLTLVAVGERPVLFVVLGSGDRFGDTEALINWFTNVYQRSR